MLGNDQNLQKMTKFFSTTSSIEVCQLGGPKPGVEQNGSQAKLVKGVGRRIKVPVEHASLEWGETEENGKILTS